MTSPDETVDFPTRLKAAIVAVDFPITAAQEIIGCTRSTLYNWMEGAQISGDYRDNALMFVEVLELCIALGALPLTDCKRKTVYITFFQAMARLREQLQARS